MVKPNFTLLQKSLGIPTRPNLLEYVTVIDEIDISQFLHPHFKVKCNDHVYGSTKHIQIN